ncbi:MAG: M20/M25/M40 family metallo-hydrolase, partial [Clostridia bacterium]
VVFLLYNNKSVISFLEQHKKSPQLAVDMVGGNSGGVDGGCANVVSDDEVNKRGEVNCSCDKVDNGGKVGHSDGASGSCGGGCVEIENMQGENMTEFNQKRYSQSLSDMVKIATVSHGDEERTDNIDAMQDYLRKRFKNVASQCEWRDFDGGLLIKWKGKDSAKKPLVLMSHMDVVSAGDGWNFEPFGGKIEDGKIFGRGTADTKGSLCAIFESVEKLIDDHFAPCSDIYILSSSREEVAGKDARLMAQYFVDNGICPSLLVDEGGAILDKPMAGVEGEYAMIAMSERSSAKLYLQGNAEAVAALEKKAVKAKLIKSVFPPEVEEMFRRLSKTMTQPMKFVFKNFNVFRGLLLKLLPKISAQAGAMVKPSVAFKPSDNEDYARSCTIASTFYLDIDKVVASFEKLANKCGVSVTTQTVRKAPRPTDFDHDGIKLVERAVVESMPSVAPTPFIIFGGTDARHFVDVVDCVARFAPLKMNTEIVASVHNKNEYIFEDSVLGAVKFYCKLIQLFDNEDKE